MKNIGLGIAILLFAIVLELSWEGYFVYITTGTGLVGLIVTIAGYVAKKITKFQFIEQTDRLLT